MSREIILNKLYNDFLEEKTHDTNKIPKIIHQIWLGEIPDKVIKLSERIKEIHYDWEYKLWTYNNLNELNLTNLNLFNNLYNKGSQSDVLRYEILSKYGGIYLDTDFYMIKNFDDLLFLDFFTGNGSNGFEAYNGLIGCIPNHPILNKIINNLSSLDGKSITNINDIMQKTGPYLFSDITFDFFENNLNSNSVILPKEYFYSLPADLRHELRSNNYNEDFIKKYITDKSYCIHLWENSWQ